MSSSKYLEFAFDLEHPSGHRRTTGNNKFLSRVQAASITQVLKHPQYAESNKYKTRRCQSQTERLHLQQPPSPTASRSVDISKQEPNFNQNKKAWCSGSIPDSSAWKFQVVARSTRVVFISGGFNLRRENRLRRFPTLASLVYCFFFLWPFGRDLRFFLGPF